MRDAVAGTEKGVQARTQWKVCESCDIVVCEVYRILWLFLCQLLLRRWRLKDWGETYTRDTEVLDRRNFVS